MAVLLAASTANATAQTLVPADHGPRMGTREQLTAVVDSLQLAVNRHDPGSDERTLVEQSIRAVSARLLDGDIHPGDVVNLTVVGEERWSTQHTVTPTRMLALESIDPLDVSGVLYAELEEHIALHLARYLREPRITVDVLKRIGVTGFVANPGFYEITGSALVSEAVMLAGGPAANSNVNTIQFRRLGVTLDVPSNVVWQSMSLDDLGIQSGDEMFVPQTGSNLARFLVAALGVIISITFIAINLF